VNTDITFGQSRGPLQHTQSMSGLKVNIISLFPFPQVSNISMGQT